ncbi:dihydroorotase [Polymorphobacter multimanifer]|uniref:Dihydroorotase n=1 Tax=Polymorphobacter multimanifer TaxID=1070431 RepID=A0A841LDH6_9SPHN|nr:dihydroorotase [Polymorphobacter multimanifer]MBB6229063.1 dihydroorotase [Polymorphobacter multimanifer]GGI84409.1 dihydroorotase [Polymorphobacter multimanifer]
MAQTPRTLPSRILLRQPDDWHVHLRDGAMLEAVVADTARQFARAIVMPNLKPPVTTTALGTAYRDRIRAATPAGVAFEPLITLYLTDALDPDEVRCGVGEGVFTAAKLYPANATTNSAAGVTDVANIRGVLAVMQDLDMPLLIHGEVTERHIDIFDREAVFIERTLIPLVRDFPGLRIVFEHITTAEAAAFVAESGPNIAATITPHHLLLNRNAMFDGGIRPHAYCLPVVKRETHRLALVAAATGGSGKFFLGTDSAPHAVEDKESACGCAGIYNAAHALEAYAQVFGAAGALDRLQGFASDHGPDFYKLPRNSRQVVLERTPQQVPVSIHAAGTSIVPFLAGTTLDWTFAGFADQR